VRFRCHEQTAVPPQAGSHPRSDVAAYGLIESSKVAVVPYHVSLNGLSHVFGDARPLEALRDVTFGVPRGQFLSIIGPSGCGKSTLLRAAGGLLRASAGEALVDGAAPIEAQRAREIGYVFQDPALLPWRTVLGNVRLPFEVDSIARRRSVPKPEEIVEAVGLGEFKNYYPHQLSGGMQQRVAIARALVFNPSLLLMDEPFGALDEITRSTMRYELLRLWETHGRRTVLFVTHSIAEAVALADRVVVMTDRPGSVKADLDIELERPRTPEIEQSTAFRDYADHLRGLLREVTVSGYA
jgi:NitT/TauT family transport system ATP-binding protein